MHDNPPSRERKPTLRRSPERSAHNDSTASRFSSPGLMASTRKIADLVSGPETGCEIFAASGVDTWGLETIGFSDFGAKDTIEKCHCPERKGSDSLSKLYERRRRQESAESGGE